ncbi:outer membrane beta-barrel protein [Helicobacter cynogastricus]|uniref:outer membrane beta-barrel protein n=1 Tax=Helicobacter cynogastricus TaxID=329937 RepID=UPI001F407EFB|nr:outer membrane beta-barrel protein [Helicobacter cynogastricus]
MLVVGVGVGAPQEKIWIKEQDTYTRLYNQRKQLRLKNGGYFGMGFGAVEIEKDYQNTKLKSFPAILSAKGGMQTFFKDYIGIRAFIALDLATSKVNWQSKPNLSNSFYGVASVGLEIPLEFPLTHSYKHYLGVYAGVGFGVALYTDDADFSFKKHNDIHTAGLIAQAGVALTLYNKHRIEVGLKLLPTNKTLLASDRFQTSLMLSCMYLYKF